MKSVLKLCGLLFVLPISHAFADEMTLNCYDLKNNKETSWSYSLLGDCISFDKDEVVITRFCEPGVDELRISTKDIRCYVKSNVSK